MSDKPGLIRRFFRFIGRLAHGIRVLFNLLFVLIVVALIISMFQKDVQPLPESAALRIAPGGFLVEQKTYTDPLTQLMQQSSPADAETLVQDVVEAIDRGATDPRINSLVLELDYLLGGGLTKLEDVGKALKDFRKSGKPIIAVGDNFTQEQYYLASYADEIHLNPMGAVLIAGFGSYHSYFKDALDKLRVNVNVFRVGTYKDAIEPFTRTDMSPASREHNSAWLNALWSVYTSRVESQRNQPIDAINDYVNNLGAKLAAYQGNTAELAVATGLVDKLSTRPQMADRLRQLAGVDEDGNYQGIDMKRYLSHTRRAEALEPTPVGDKIGIIVAKGMILDGEQPAGTVGGDSLAQRFQQARKDDQLKALVLRIDSPGGSAFASEVIRQELLATRKAGLPVIVSMGTVAASGGYWIAMGANEVWASPTTITGSIGVFGVIPTFEESLAALGINNDGIGTTELADLYQLDRPMSDQAKQVVQSGVNHIYDHFLSLVADARGTSPEAIHEVAQGRVWTGAKARELGLVDELGDLQAAIEAAARVAGLEQYEVEEIRKPLDFREQLLQELANGQVAGWLVQRSQGWMPQSWLMGLYSLGNKLNPLGRLNDPRGMYLQCFECDVP
ncbi:signal peptide peptidase SppA [Porticoccus litoralis]|uniref:Signal peptide peptidase SppA n=1 Tax=Porticoccus litoralis TaxID=434086 RepID=A0AAW8B2D3_9GAMM|nr:signal peptide peptidase SppA [Porticoccus litoralis]MDP1519939.1 signal peptide peptidase SppA [Porticoccus litoralis]